MRTETGKLSGKPECPYCKKILDAFTGMEGKKPSKDDFTICVYCKNILVFNTCNSYRKPTREEYKLFQSQGTGDLSKLIAATLKDMK